MNKETDEFILSSFNSRDTSKIVLDADESNLLHALKEYSDSASKVLEVIKHTLGTDCSKWSKHPKMIRIKPYLRDWWLESEWRPKIVNASLILKCSEEDVVATMKAQLKKPSTKELKASNPELYKLTNKVRRCVLYFIENSIVGRALALKQVTN